MMRLLALGALACAGALGLLAGLWWGSTVDWEAVQIERNLGLLGAVRVRDLKSGPWTQACLFQAFDDWGNAPGPRLGVPPWYFQKHTATILLADAAGRTHTVRLLWMGRAPGVPDCVPIGQQSRLVAERHKCQPWLLHFE